MSATARHWEHHDGHLPYGRWIGVLLAFAALIAGLFALVAQIAQDPVLMQSYEMPQFPPY